MKHVTGMSVQMCTIYMRKMEEWKVELYINGHNASKLSFDSEGQDDDTLGKNGRNCVCAVPSAVGHQSQLGPLGDIIVEIFTTNNNYNDGRNEKQRKKYNATDHMENEN